jgi:ankyrin repeat protein
MSAKPLWQACRDADAPILQQLLRQGANPNAPWRGYPPLHTLTQRDAHTVAPVTPQILACIEILLDHGADPLVPAGFPPTSVLRLAAFSGAQAIIDLLHHRGIKEEQLAPTQTDRYGLQPLHYLSGSRLSPPPSAVAKLLKSGADPNAETKAGNHAITPIYLAASASNLAIYKILLQHGADPNRALTAASWNTHPFPEYAQPAIDHGAHPDRATADGKPLLNHLIQWGRMQQAYWLRDRGANPNLPDAEGWTALHQCASRGNAKMLAALIAHGADRARRCKLGHTAADVARITGRPQLEAELR